MHYGKTFLGYRTTFKFANKNQSGILVIETEDTNDLGEQMESLMEV